MSDRVGGRGDECIVLFCKGFCSLPIPVVAGGVVQYFLLSLIPYAISAPPLSRLPSFLAPHPLLTLSFIHSLIIRCTFTLLLLLLLQKKRFVRREIMQQKDLLSFSPSLSHNLSYTRLDRCRSSSARSTKERTHKIPPLTGSSRASSLLLLFVE